MRQVLMFAVLLLAVVLCLVSAQQYVPVLVPAAVLNQTRPLGFNSTFNSSRPYNNSNVYKPGNVYGPPPPPGPYFSYQPSNSSRVFNSTRFYNPYNPGQYSPYGNNYYGNGYAAPSGQYSPNQYPNYPPNLPYANVSTTGGYGGHLFLGYIQNTDRLLFNQEYRKESRWWSSRDKYIDYPSNLPSGYLRHEIISAIRIYNKFQDGANARALVLKGGVGHSYVQIKLESQWNKGFQFLVQIYGH